MSYHLQELELVEFPESINLEPHFPAFNYVRSANKSENSQTTRARTAMKSVVILRNGPTVVYVCVFLRNECEKIVLIVLRRQKFRVCNAEIVRKINKMNASLVYVNFTMIYDAHWVELYGEIFFLLGIRRHLLRLTGIYGVFGRERKAVQIFMIKLCPL